LRLEAPDGSSNRALVGYTGDTGPSDSVNTFLTGCSLLVSECALDDPPEMDGHLSPRGVAALAAIARPELLVLTHVYPPQAPHSAARAVQQAYSGPVVAAQDGLRLMVDPEGRVTRLPVDPSAGPV
jgi:ribonuclease BN (tRNA processing enzyme)